MYDLVCITNTKLYQLYYTVLYHYHFYKYIIAIIDTGSNTSAVKGTLQVDFSEFGQSAIRIKNILNGFGIIRIDELNP